MRGLKLDLLTGGASVYRREKFSGASMKNRAARRAEFRRFRQGSDGGAQSYTQKNNDDAQALVLAVAQPMIQQVYQNTITGNNAAQSQILNIPLTNVGLNTKLTVEVTFTITQAAAETLNKTAWGLANFFSNIQLTDLSNYQRINTSGRHLFALATLRRQGAFGAAFLNDSPVNIGSNVNICNGPAAITGAKTCRMFFELPIAYHDFDLRGAIYAAVTSATWRLQLTVNPSVIVASTVTDALNACYKSTTADVGLLSAVTIKVYQHYLDQLPQGRNGAVVPLMSLAWNYLLQSTTIPAITASVDNVVQYANFRTFLSTIAIYNQNGTFAPGSDVNYVGIQAANLVFFEQLDAFMAGLKTRHIIGDDFPPGTYVFDHRRKPIITNQYGNQQFVLNPSSAAASSTLEMNYEMLAIQAQAINSGSLAQQ